MFLGNDLLAYVVLALGGALAVGNGLALVRPPQGVTQRPPFLRTVVMMAVGGIAAIWAVGSLVSK